jgi:flagellin
LISEIDRIADNSTFNGIKLLDGSYKDQYLQVGAGNEANDRIAISIGDARTARLGAAVTAATEGVAITNGASIADGEVTINGFNVGKTTSDGVSIYNSEGSAISKANAINAIADKTGVIASAKASTITLTATASTSGTGKFEFLLNGAVVSGYVEDAENVVGSASNIAAAINAQTNKTGVVATISLTDPGKYTLTAADGRNILLSINAEDLAVAKGVGKATLSPEWGNTGIDTAADATTAAPNLFQMKSDDTTKDSVVIYGRIDLSTDSLAGITIGGDKASTETLGIEAKNLAASKSAGSGVGSVNLNTSTGAQSALTTLDRAINAVTDMRASMGAYQNRLTASISNLENTSMNLSASRSRILDTDYAKETTNLAKSQIIQQAATAMLAQANQSAQSVLALLK